MNPADLQTGDRLVLRTPMVPKGLVPSSFPVLTELEVLQVFPDWDDGYGGKGVLWVNVWDTQSWPFFRFRERWKRGLFKVVRLAGKSADRSRSK